jgi:hypothetical protein
MFALKRESLAAAILAVCVLGAGVAAHIAWNATAPSPPGRAQAASPARDEPAGPSAVAPILAPATVTAPPVQPPTAAKRADLDAAIALATAAQPDTAPVPLAEGRSWKGMSAAEAQAVLKRAVGAAAAQETVSPYSAR